MELERITDGNRMFADVSAGCFPALAGVDVQAICEVSTISAKSHFAALA
jgi:hypothetical protein